MKKKIIIGIIVLLILMIVLAFLYLFTGNYNADKEAYEFLVSDENVTVSKIDDGYFFDGKGSNIAIIFYPGAKVEYIAYSKMMYDLASDGYDCFMLEMPFNIAFFGKDKAKSILDTYDYESIFVAGHSLGGVVANGFAVDNIDRISGIINLASYPAEQIPKQVPYLLIYGSEDMVMYKEKYEESKKYMPEGFKEIVIDGGNHAGFAQYGIQDKDGEPQIGSDEQEAIAVEEINKFIEEYNEIKKED